MAEDRVAHWREIWQRHRRRCLLQEEIPADGRAAMSPQALAILERMRALAAVDDPAVHAGAGLIDELIDQVNELEGREPLLLHTPVCNGLAMLRSAAQSLLSAIEAHPTRAAPGPASAAPALPVASRFDWFLVVGGDEVLAALVEECAASLTARLPVHVATTMESAMSRLGRRGESGIVVTNLTLLSEGPGPHGLRVASEARHRRHAALLVTAAADYLHYWSRLAEAGLTGHDVMVKTRRDFPARLRQRIWEIAEPAPLGVSYEEETGHVMWIGEVEVTRLEGQEALVLRVLDDAWQSSEAIADACRETDLAPTPGSVPPLISTLRTKIAAALVDAESPHAQREVIQSRRREGWPTQYRLAPWLRWQDPPEPGGAARGLPPVLVIEDDPDWAYWVSTCLAEWGWPVTIVDSVEVVPRLLASADLPIIVSDLALCDSPGGVPDFEVGLRFLEGLALDQQGLRVIVLSAFGWRDSVRRRLFDAGVRMVDVIDKAGDRDECAAILLASLQRGVDETRRGVRRPREPIPLHRVVRAGHRLIQVDGRSVERLSLREAAIVEALLARAGLPVKAEFLEATCFPLTARPTAGARYNPLNKVHSTVARLRRKIDRAAGVSGVGEAVIRTPHRGARTTYELSGIVIDLVE